MMSEEKIQGLLDVYNREVENDLDKLGGYVWNNEEIDVDLVVHWLVFHRTMVEVIKEILG